MHFPGHGNLHFFPVVKLKGSKSYLHVRFQFVLQHICRIRFNNPVFRGKDKRVQYKIAIQNWKCKCIFRLPLPKTIWQVWTRECSTISLLTMGILNIKIDFKMVPNRKGQGKKRKHKMKEKIAGRLLNWLHDFCSIDKMTVFVWCNRVFLNFRFLCSDKCLICHERTVSDL